MKPVYKSKTVWGLLVAALPVVGQLCGIEIAQGEADPVVQAAGLLLALYGRWRAVEPLGVQGAPAGDRGLTLGVLLMLCLLPAVLLQPACTSLDPANPELKARLTQRAFDLGVRLGTYKVIEQNPEFAEAALAIAVVLEGSETTDGLVELINEELLPRQINNPADLMLAQETVLTFADLFRADLDRLGGASYLPILAKNIRAGVRYAQLGAAPE